MLVSGAFADNHLITAAILFRFCTCLWCSFFFYFSVLLSWVFFFFEGALFTYYYYSWHPSRTDRKRNATTLFASPQTSKQVGGEKKSAFGGVAFQVWECEGNIHKREKAKCRCFYLGTEKCLRNLQRPLQPLTRSFSITFFFYFYAFFFFFWVLFLFFPLCYLVLLWSSFFFPFTLFVMFLCSSSASAVSIPPKKKVAKRRIKGCPLKACLMPLEGNMTDRDRRKKC